MHQVNNAIIKILLELEHLNYNIGEQVEIAAFALIPKSTVLQEVLSD